MSLPPLVEFRHAPTPDEQQAFKAETRGLIRVARDVGLTVGTALYVNGFRIMFEQNADLGDAGVNFALASLLIFAAGYANHDLQHPVSDVQSAAQVRAAQQQEESEALRQQCAELAQITWEG